MPHFDPAASTTGDVVRQVIIPLSCHTDGTVGQAMSSVIYGGKPRLAHSMITHNWDNTFSNLVAAVLANCLGCRTFEQVRNILMEGNFAFFKERLRQIGEEKHVCWICAFSVNQHASICSSVGVEPDHR